MSVAVSLFRRREGADRLRQALPTGDNAACLQEPDEEDDDDDDDERSCTDVHGRSPFVCGRTRFDE
jgi:hypothetical protein